MNPAPQVTSTMMKIIVAFAVVTFTMTKLVNNGLNVSENVEDGFIKRASKMEKITSPPVTPVFNIT
jgi:hypothetical protein